MPGSLRTTVRYLYQLKYLKPVQIRARLKQCLPRPKLTQATGSPTLRKIPGSWCRPAPLPHRQVGPSRFVLLSQSREVELPADWHDRTPGKKWLMELHAFHVLWDAAQTEGQELILDWIAHNPDPQGPGWHPYITSQRICNWLKWSLAGNTLSAEALASLVSQLQYLQQVLCKNELDHKLLNNGKALLFSGLLLEDPGAPLWRREGHVLFRRYCGELLGRDGGYSGLSPMYHCALLLDLLDVTNLLFALGFPAEQYLEDSIDRARYWLVNLCHPDGEIALFNDAALEVAPRPADLDGYARRLGFPAIATRGDGLTLLADTGYARLAGTGAIALLDVGGIGPDRSPSHGHADTFTFEMSLHGRRLIVDTGLSTYEEMPARLQQRETAAHNTLVLDGRNSSDVWSRFKVGRRARVRDLSHSEHHTGVSVGATHDGYVRPGNRLLHRREWNLEPGQLSIIDKVGGHGQHRIQIMFHLHPGLEARPVGSNVFALQDERGSRLATLLLEPGMEVRVSDYLYHPRFGQSLDARCLVLGYKGKLPRQFTSQLNWSYPNGNED